MQSYRAPLVAIDDTAKVPRDPHRPRRGNRRDTEDAFDVAEHLERAHAPPVVRVDERQQRYAWSSRHFEETQRLRLYAAGGVKQHDGGVGGGEHTERVF